MNCEAYIAFYREGNLDLYPNNIDATFLSGILASLPDEVGRHADFLAIRRKGDMVYYAFIAPLMGAGKDKVGIMVGLNNLLITDIVALGTFMRHTMRSLADKYRDMARYDESLGVYLSPDTDADSPAADIPAAYATLRDRFNERFNGCGTQPGPTDYSHSPQTDLRALLPDGSLQASSPLSPAQSVESGNTLLVQIQHPEVMPQTEDIREPDPEAEDENGSPQTDEAHEGSDEKTGKKGRRGCIWIWTCLITFFAIIGAIYIMYSDSSEGYPTSAPEAIDTVPSSAPEVITPDTERPAEEAEAAAAPWPDTQVCSDAAILAEGTELLYDIGNTLTLFYQGQATEYQLIEKFTNLRWFIHSISQSGFQILAINGDFLDLWYDINWFAIKQRTDTGIYISSDLEKEYEWFNECHNSLNEYYFDYYDEYS